MSVVERLALVALFGLQLAACAPAVPAGFAAQEAVLPAALSIDPAARVTFPAMFTSISGQGENTLAGYTTAQIPRAENGWRGGSNRGGWSNPEYDRLFEAFTNTLDPTQRGAQLAQMARIFTEELPMISLLFLAVPYAYTPALRGPTRVAPEGLLVWNIHEWNYDRRLDWPLSGC